MGIAPLATITLFTSLVIASSDKRFAENQAATDKRFAENQAAADKRFSDLIVSLKEVKIEEAKVLDLKFAMKLDKILTTNNTK